MPPSYIRLGALLSLLACSACGAESGEEARLGDTVAAQVGDRESAGQPVRACDILDLTAAASVLGPGTENPGGDTEALTCMYLNAGVAMLTVQLGGSDLYDHITILPPHTSVDIGEKGRYTVLETGGAAMQFVRGDYSVTLSVQPIGSREEEFLEPLLSAAREAAGRLP